MCTGGIISSRDLLEQNLIARKHVGFVELSRHSLNGFLTGYVNLQVSTGICLPNVPLSCTVKAAFVPRRSHVKTQVPNLVLTLMTAFQGAH